jgi:hypothetical protein
LRGDLRLLLLLLLLLLAEEDGLPRRCSSKKSGGKSVRRVRRDQAERGSGRGRVVVGGDGGGSADGVRRRGDVPKAVEGEDALGMGRRAVEVETESPAVVVLHEDLNVVAGL